MKSSVVLGMVASLLLASGAEAAKSSRVSAQRARPAAGAKAKAAKGSKSATTQSSGALADEPDLGSSAQGAQNLPNSVSSSNVKKKNSLAAPAATSSTSVKVAPRKLKAQLFNWNSIATKDLNRQTGAVSASDNYLGLKYSFNDRQALMVRQQFTYDFPHGEEEGKGTVNDIYVRYTDSKLVKFANDGTIALRLQAYLPTGENSRNYEKHQGIFATRFILSKPINKTFSFDYAVQGTAYNQSLSNYINKDGKEKSTKQFAAMTFANMNVEIGAGFSFYQLVGFQNVVSNELTSGAHEHQRNVFLEGALAYGGIPNTTLYLGVDQSSSVQNGETFSPWDEDKGTGYFFALEASI